MLRLAVATDAETFQRMGEPLAARDIAVRYVPTSEGVLILTGDSADWTDGGLLCGTDSQRFEGMSDAADQRNRDTTVDVGFVFPPRLAEGGVADALLDIPWVNDREAVLRSRHKGEALARLDRAGIPIPETVVVSNPVDETTLTAVFDRFDGPVVVKPNATTKGVGVARADDLDSFLGLCDYLDLVHDYRATGDQSFLVQEFLPNARDYRAMVVDGSFVGAVERRLPEAHTGGNSSDAAEGRTRWKHNVHRGARATGVDLPADLRDLAEDTAAALDIPWLGVDILVSDGRAVVNETNARPTIDDATKYEDGFWDDLAALVRERT